jgi:hypothetical protein
MGNLHVLSIDIDFFVEPKPQWISMNSVERLAAPYRVDPQATVKAFLTEQARLDPRNPIRGCFMRDHDQAFDIVVALAARHGPVRLTHVDAHADLGMGDSGYRYLMAEWLARPDMTAIPLRGNRHMNLSNWLAFAAGGGHIERIEFVPRRKPNDLMRHYFRTDPDTAAELDFRVLTTDELDRCLYNTQEEEQALMSSKALVRAVPWRVVGAADFRLDRPPDYVAFCQSPQFTPRAADRILRFARKCVVEDDLGVALKPPLVNGW